MGVWSEFPIKGTWAEVLKFVNAQQDVWVVELMTPPDGWQESIKLNNGCVLALKDDGKIYQYTPAKPPKKQYTRPPYQLFQSSPVVRAGGDLGERLQRFEKAGGKISQGTFYRVDWKSQGESITTYFFQFVDEFGQGSTETLTVQPWPVKRDDA